MSFQRILIIQTAFLGDVILITSILEKLHLFYPEAQIDILIKKEAEQLFRCHPFIRNVILWQKKRRKYWNLLKIIRKLRFSKYNLLINFQRHASTGFISVFSKADYTIGFQENIFSFLFSEKYPYTTDAKQPIHEIEKNHLLISNLTDAHSQRPKLYLPDDVTAFIEPYQKGEYICIFPGSIWKTKQFPFEKWIDFIGKLPENVYIYLLGSWQDVNICTKIALSCKNVTVLAGKLELLQSAALMQKAIINFANDSAPTHIASAVNAKICTVFCSTIPQFGFIPLSDFSETIEIEYELQCRPCGSHGRKQCPQKHFKCARDIGIQKIVDIFWKAFNLRNSIK